MHITIIGDLHLGSEFCQAARFKEFLNRLNKDSTLVLNGDTITRWDRDMTEEHCEALELIKKASLKRRVVWIQGNHDCNYHHEDPANIEFRDEWSVNEKTVIIHGHQFDKIRRLCNPLLILISWMHKLSIKLGATPHHVSFYAKTFPVLYKPYKFQFIKNAVRYARRNGFKEIICGHIHHAEDTTVKGIRYLNAGPWTELPVYQITINKDTNMEEVSFE